MGPSRARSTDSSSASISTLTTRNNTDKLIIDQNQQGVNSRYYRPGPYGPMESQTRSFSEWYLKELGAAPGG